MTQQKVFSTVKECKQCFLKLHVESGTADLTAVLQLCINFFKKKVITYVLQYFEK